MARSKRDIEAYLVGLNKSWEEVGEGTYLVRSSGDENATPVVLQLSEKVLLCHVTIGDAPKGLPEQELELYRKLLILNSTDLLYCSYGLDGEQIVLSAALEMENLDINELEAVLADMELALLRHVPVLRDLARGDTTKK
jgi:hypothetical protein